MIENHTIKPLQTTYLTSFLIYKSPADSYVCKIMLQMCESAGLIALFAFGFLYKRVTPLESLVFNALN